MWFIMPTILAAENEKSSLTVFSLFSVPGTENLQSLFLCDVCFEHFLFDYFCVDILWNQETKSVNLSIKWFTGLHVNQKGWNLKEDPLSIEIVDWWVLSFVLKTNCKKKPLVVFHFWELKSSSKKIQLSLSHTGHEQLPHKWLNNILLKKIPTSPFDFPKTRKQTLY